MAGETVCKGKALEEDELKPAEALKSSAPDQPSSAFAPVFRDQKKAEEMINEFKRGLIPPELRH
ncbi:hypothetical protein [Ottowia caeni]|uniref:hypothetical protein n=1 Tax=Ottowia caeni TaxID=2870339 RepID=UPI001E29C690|nr:hypothetical protein [Ottowia caeni]